MIKQKYILSVDQSTQGTKALLFDPDGGLLCRSDLPHRQIVSHAGWVSHDLSEIYHNTVQAVRDVVEKSGIDKSQIAGMGISNQRETAAAWYRDSGDPAAHAIVWQCSRAKDICARIENQEHTELVRTRTGIPLSPYFPASKYTWFLENIPNAEQDQKDGKLLFGTMDAWLVFKLTKGKSYKTDYSNASRTQLFNIHSLSWDTEICELFNINPRALPEVCDSNALFGETDFEGFFDRPIPIHGVLGDSHGALFGQGCLQKGMTKTTYGTGSSVMMHIGDRPILSSHGIVTSLAWGMDGKVSYVLEGNINYTGAVVTWLKDDMQMIRSSKETEEVARNADADDAVYIVPAFTGLGAPYWSNEARAAITGLTRTSGRAEIVRAGLECIAYQIKDIVEAMNRDSGVGISELRVDGGPTRNRYLMQFQSDILNLPVQVPDAEELSGIGAAYAAGLALGVFKPETVFQNIGRKKFVPEMGEPLRRKKYAGWLHAVHSVLPDKEKL